MGSLSARARTGRSAARGAPFFFAAVLLVGCGIDALQGHKRDDRRTGRPMNSADGGAPVDGGVDGGLDGGVVVTPAPGCMVESSPPHQSTHHVDAGQAVEYTHNPPTSGNHWPIWGRYMDHGQDDVPREIYVHNLEPGGVALLAGPAAPAALVEQLRAAYEAIPLDAECVDAGHPHQRSLMVYDPLLDDAVAVAAWDYVLEGNCVSAEQIASFVSRHRGRGGEDDCGDGQW